MLLLKIWSKDHQTAYFDVNLFLLNSSNVTERNEQERKQEYDERIREIERGTFSPLVFSIAGGIGPISTRELHQ